MVHQERAVGVMSAGWCETGRFNEGTGQTLDAVAAQVATALDNASLDYFEIDITGDVCLEHSGDDRIDELLAEPLSSAGAQNQ